MQHDFNVSGSQTFPNFIADLNNAIESLVTTSSGNNDPVVTFPNQLHVNTSTTPAVIKIRNPDNSAWIILGTAENLFGISLASLGGAPLLSPELTGNPTAPTQLTADNSTRIATTALVNNKLASSPGLGGNPTVATQATTDNSTRIANTAFVNNKISDNFRLQIARYANQGLGTRAAWFTPDYNTTNLSTAEYNSGTKAFTVGATGFYRITHSCSILASGGTSPSSYLLYIGYSLNGAEVSSAVSTSPYPYCAASFTKDELLTAGQVIIPRVYFDWIGGSGFTNNILGGDRPGFSITRLT